jgi:hypothetical protein
VIEEADEATNAMTTSIMEMDETIIAMIECKDAEDESRAEYIQRADMHSRLHMKRTQMQFQQAIGRRNRP